jgi:hypothetical protein
LTRHHSGGTTGLGNRNGKLVESAIIAISNQNSLQLAADLLRDGSIIQKDIHFETQSQIAEFFICRSECKQKALQQADRLKNIPLRYWRLMFRKVVDCAIELERGNMLPEHVLGGIEWHESNRCVQILTYDGLVVNLTVLELDGAVEEHPMAKTH